MAGADRGGERRRADPRADRDDRGREGPRGGQRRHRRAVPEAGQGQEGRARRGRLADRRPPLHPGLSGDRRRRFTRARPSHRSPPHGVQLRDTADHTAAECRKYLGERPRARSAVCHHAHGRRLRHHLSRSATTSLGPVPLHPHARLGRRHRPGSTRRRSSDGSISTSIVGTCDTSDRPVAPATSRCAATPDELVHLRAATKQWPSSRSASIAARRRRHAADSRTSVITSRPAPRYRSELVRYRPPRCEDHRLAAPRRSATRRRGSSPAIAAARQQPRSRSPQRVGASCERRLPRSHFSGRGVVLERVRRRQLRQLAIGRSARQRRMQRVATCAHAAISIGASGSLAPRRSSALRARQQQAILRVAPSSAGRSSSGNGRLRRRELGRLVNSTRTRSRPRARLATSSERAQIADAEHAAWARSVTTREQASGPATRLYTSASATAAVSGSARADDAQRHSP